MNFIARHVFLASMAIGSAVAFAQNSPGVVHHMCGGIGQGEQQRMKEAALDHDLMLTFATTSGAYMADVAVQIRDRRGANVVDVKCDGPILLVSLPSNGSYRVTANAGGVARERTVNVQRGRTASATFVWPAGN